ncbi:hypothetical protein BHE74_00027622 [Ensete ventricosum]|nr:hypothetical protein GW17_00006386 [Ensete ventricosum]RWW65088.1 hypothetical protein BHE74_00027622 [Ensete ventricosum]
MVLHLMSGQPMKGGLLLLLMCLVCVRHGFSFTDPQDVYALKGLSDQWKNTPPNWRHSNDPCGDLWDGVRCTNSRVKELKLFSMGIEGILSDYIQNLTELTLLDLSFNKKLGGPLPASIGNLKQLQTLRLINCSFSGSIPDEVGNLLNLTSLSLNSNNFTGKIPGSLGRLDNLTWLDLADNQLHGIIPTSSNGVSGLDQLVKNLHFHLNQNQLSGPIPSNLFRSDMKAIHMLLDHNNFSGEIPESIGLVQSLQILRLDENSLYGSIPSTINNLTSLNVLNLGSNKLTGQMPNLTGMPALNCLNLSNNLFDPSEAPAWLLDVQNLTTLIIESGKLHGEVPEKLFSLPRLQEVRLNNNSFNGTLNMGSNISQQLKMVNFQNNDFTAVTLSSNYNKTIILVGNPICDNTPLQKTEYCGQGQVSQSSLPEVDCSLPYEGPINCRAPSFGDQNIDISQMRDRIKTMLDTFPVNHTLTNYYFDPNAYLVVKLKICHRSAKSFTRNQTLQWLDLSTQKLDLPDIYGPCVFSPDPYPYPNNGHRAWIIGTAVGCAAAIFIIAGLGIYALRQKKQAKTAIDLNNPFASWGSTGEDAGDAPHIRLARCFSLDELRKFTDGFSVDNEIGSGGYGKVKNLVIISQKGSTQGGLEFKTEIEMLSRVHHKNLVELVGFCFEKGERTLVYEYISNGTLTKNLSGRSRIKLDWKQRLNIALDSARGLAYLHELAKPPIIHRDVKSTNILLDDNLSAKVADFGLSTLILDSDHGHVSTNVKGTLGYLDPEYFMTQQLTTKSDVYSFGVVMLELIAARLPIEKGKYIVCEVKMAIDENDEEYYGLKDIIDPAILNAGSLIGFQRFVELALQCLKDTSEDRPTMNDIVKEIEILLKDNRLEANSISASSSATYFGNARGASEQPYDEMPITSEVNSSGAYGSDNYLLSQ